ncbi:MAG TPA: DUF4190 domain-containing protein [Candidatus Avoscillospira avicola]|uniref:DUF4190 domain-containing protein n=1 Tax=Candidatus Avoscillospira avicola TaxID=2840706 RepID=A0A9D1AQ34_9FIRM|nr:DUF4190 domain-containing protein [Candidatus Avoscillospira avicola]
MSDEMYTPNPTPEGQETNKMSIAALVCGILGIVGSFIPVISYFTLVLAILGIVFGSKGMKIAKITGQGQGLATAGLVLGIIGTAFGVIGVLCIICAAGALAAAGSM